MGGKDKGTENDTTLSYPPVGRVDSWCVEMLQRSAVGKGEGACSRGGVV